MSSESPRRRIVVKEEDLDELYMLVQGAPYANTLLDAKTTLAQHEHAKTLQLVQSARERFRQSHTRTLRWDGDEAAAGGQTSRDAARMRQRLMRCRLVLEAFDEVIAILEKMIKLRAGQASATVPQGGPTYGRPSESLVSTQFRTEYEIAHTARAEMSVIRRHFTASKVESELDIQPHQLYYLRGKEHAYLLIVSEAEPGQEQVPIRLALSGQVMQPLAREKFLELGRKQSVVRLIPRSVTGEADANEVDDMLMRALDPQPESVESAEQGLLDKGTFTQLHDAAQRSGLVPNADVIAYVRDREFRLKAYQKALQLIEGLFGKFCAAATRREQRLRREDIDIASGKIQMSPKQLMEKRARDTAESQLVERARHKFLRVLEGLRVMMRTS